ncbi:MAG TPA: ribosome silencing factor [Clostridiales bacterium]|jgi:ribosome-associated protein|nr:ribosome silencing factor [Clostridiales bacterium]
MTSKDIVKKAVQILDSKKAEDIVVLDIQKLTSLGDYFVIASANNTTLVQTLAEEVEEKLSEAGVEPRKVEGATSAMWILMDYNDVVIHIFYNQTREFYCLERLWGDAPKLDVAELLQ